LSIHPFEQVPLAELLAKATSQTDTTSPPNQLMLWE
jgi:hypothetical protein